MKCRLRGWYINGRELTEHLVGRKKKRSNRCKLSHSQKMMKHGEDCWCVFLTTRQPGTKKEDKCLHTKDNRGGHIQVKTHQVINKGGEQKVGRRIRDEMHES